MKIAKLAYVFKNGHIQKKHLCFRLKLIEKNNFVVLLEIFISFYFYLKLTG